ncbi:sodium/calcium exchanger 3-like protein, partial [Leptotrombidium deliense]
AEIPIQIIDNESYEKDAVFYVELFEPIRHEDRSEESTEPPSSPKLELSPNQEKVALLGRPRLGELKQCTIRIKESKEFKNTVDKLFRKANTSFVVGASSWKEQFIEAVTVSAGDEEDEDGEQKMPTCCDYVMHFITLFWKVLFAFVPPTDYLDGWVCFVVSIIGIGLLTAVIGDLASHLGCTVGLKDTVTAIAFVALGTSVPDVWGGWACFMASIVGIGMLTAVVGDVASHFGCVVGLRDAVTAISIVALGTSLPDTFASKVAAINDQYADSSIGNVTGSNAVNVFLGIGIAWTIAAVVNAFRGQPFKVPPGNLAFSVTLFCACAFVCCTGLLIRRYVIGGELGGRMTWKLPTTIIFVGLWVMYVLLSAFEAYEMLPWF